MCHSFSMSRQDEAAAAGRSQRPSLALVGSVAFTIGASVMILLHEASHAVAGLVLGHHPLQLPFAVDYRPALNSAAQGVTAITGPLFSLVSGMIGVVIDRTVRPLRSRPFARLVWLWLVFTSLQEGFGYFTIAALGDVGDTAVALHAWGAPDWAFVAAAVFGVGGQVLAAWLFSEPLRRMCRSVDDRRDLTVWAWLLGTGAMLALMTLYVLAAPAFRLDAKVTVLAGAVSLGVFAPMSMMFGPRRNTAADRLPPARPPLAGWIALAALVAFNLSLLLGWLWP